MITIGLTGSVGMGKSTAASIFQTLGVPVFDSDACVRKVTSKYGEAVAEVIRHFPDTWDAKNKRIDRAELGRQVFKDPDERKRLEAILHPYVWKYQDAFKQEMRRARMDLIVLDIPLLFESGAETRVDMTVVVTAPPFIQYQRVMARPDMTEEKFQAILDSQMPDAQKRGLADYVVPTGLGMAETTKHIKQIIHELRKQAS